MKINKADIDSIARNSNVAKPVDEVVVVGMHIPLNQVFHITLNVMFCILIIGLIGWGLFWGALLVIGMGH
jgi:hypothetical protein